MTLLATTLSPGPSVVLVVRNALRHGRHAIAITVAGNLCAQFITTEIVALGIGKLMVAQSALFPVIRIAGATCLILVGMRQAFGRTNRGFAPDAGRVSSNGAAQIFREAFVVSGTNPNALIFLTAVMPQFIQHDAPIVRQVAVMYLTVAVTTSVVHTLYALVACGVRKYVVARANVAWIKRGSGALLIGFGIQMLVSR